MASSHPDLIADRHGVIADEHSRSYGELIDMFYTPSGDSLPANKSAADTSCYGITSAGARAWARTLRPRGTMIAAPATAAAWDDGFPIINLGLAKSGTKSLDYFLSCAGYNKTLHSKASTGGKVVHVWTSMWRCARQGRPVLDCVREDFGYFEGITQIDGGATGLSASWPQIEFLADILLDYPNATFVLTRRNESNWANSAQAFDGGAVAKGITTMS